MRALARRVGVQGVTMRDLATELGAAVPSVYYHVARKQAALDLLAESVLAEIPVFESGAWDTRLTELYGAAREVILAIPGIAGMLQTSAGGESARRLDKLSRSLLDEAGLTKPVAAATHSVLYTYLLGSVALEEACRVQGGSRQAAKAFRDGLQIILVGIRASARESPAQR